MVTTVRKLIEGSGSRSVSPESIRDPTEVYNLIAKLCQKGGFTALDIGANRGQYITLFAPRFKRVLAFEPSREAFVELIRKAKDYPNVEAYNAAILSTTGITFLYKYENAWKDFDLTVLDETHGFNCWGRRIEKVPVLALRLDDLHLSNVDFMKVDVEGAELSVIQGSIETIKKSKPIIFIEIHEKFQGEQVVALLRDMYNFKVVRHPSYLPHTLLWDKHYFLFAVPRENREQNLRLQQLQNADGVAKRYE